MKSKLWGYISILLIILVITVSGLVVQNYLENTSGDMVAGLRRIKVTTDQKNWHDSRIYFTDFMRKWKPVRNNWILFINRNEILSVEMKLSRIEEYIEKKDENNLAAELSEAIMLLEQIPERERLTWRNVF